MVILSRSSRTLHVSSLLTCQLTIQTTTWRAFHLELNRNIACHHQSHFQKFLSPVTPAALAKFSPPTHRFSQIARHLSSSSSPSPSPSDNTTTSLNTNMASSYQVRKVGAPNTLEHRIYIEKDGVPVSPFHDIPLYANEQQTILNMVVEIPRWTNAKMEVSSKRPAVFIYLCHIYYPEKNMFSILLPLIFHLTISMLPLIYNFC